MAVKEKFDGVSFGIPACKESIKLTNGLTVSDYLENASAIVRTAKEKGLLTRGYISYFIGSAYSKSIPAVEISSISSELNDMGTDEIILKDNTAMGDIQSVIEVIEALKIPKEKIGVHFYETKYKGIECAMAALSEGISNYTVSAGGIGQSSHFDTILGNMVASDLAFALECLGINHGLKWQSLLKAEEKLCKLFHRENLSDVFKVDLSENQMATYKEKVQEVLKNK